MASPFSFFTEGGVEDGMTETNPQGVEQQVTDLQAQVATLTSRLAALQGETGHAVGDLEHRMGQHLESRLSQAQAAAGHRPMSVKPPRPSRYRGNADGPKIHEWLHQAKVYLLAAGLDKDKQGVYHITSYLEGDAAIWWRHYCQQVDDGQAPEPRNWEELRKLMLEQFQVFNHVTDVRDRYVNLRQTGTVHSYITRFRALVLELPGETEEQKIYFFLRGLKPEIQARTRTLKPSTLARAMDIADEADRANSHAFGHTGRFNKTLVRESRSLNGPGSSNGPQPMQIGAISPYEQQQLRQQNRCFYCRKQGHQAKDCLKKKADQAKAKKGSGRQQRRKPEN